MLIIMKQLHSIFLSIIPVYFAFMKCYRGKKRPNKNRLQACKRSACKTVKRCHPVLFGDVFGWTRSDQDLKPSCYSKTETDLILLKKTGHGGTGVPVIQETRKKFTFKNVLMSLAPHVS